MKRALAALSQIAFLVGMQPVAVIDIGSNSIKLLVARRGTNCRRVKTVYARPIDARISAGINHTEPRLSAEGMAVGLAAIQALLSEAISFAPETIQLVATSAVRDALNRDEFIALVKKATGHSIRTLSGAEEASYIGQGMLADPALQGAEDGYVFDLGGGSLECLRLRARHLETALSLPLGCVRLAEKFITDRTAPLSSATARAIQAHVQATLREAGFHFALPTNAPAIGTGGTMFTCRAILAHRQQKTVEDSSPRIELDQLSALTDEVTRMTCHERSQIPGLAAARADVFPTALLTLLAVMQLGNLTTLLHSNYNLRFGLADELLPK